MNPIKQKHLNYTYDEMAERTGLHINTIYNLSNMSEKELLNISIGTAETLRIKLGINILKHIQSYKLIKK